ncbi:hypothetical protein ACNVED_14580 [Legionella sp. D16C41]|uniref:hypothetical protein n=1 Tax=Legionella sp. D16C41 TaxID=3402688 RepID=UPI003AF4777C
MVYIFNRVLGLLVGPILYSVKSLLINSIISIAILTLSVLAALGLPFISSHLIYKKLQINKPDNALIKAILAGLTLLILTPLIPCFVSVAIILLTLVDTLISAYRGLIEGFKTGLFFYVLSSATKDFEKFSSIFNLLFVAFESLGDRDAFYKKSIDSLITLREHETLFPLRLLNKKEIQLASTMPELKFNLQHYLSLYERLEQLDKAITKRLSNHSLFSNETTALDDDLITDEVISLMPITIPILIVKQFKDKEDNWKAVVGSTNISDFDNLQESMKACRKSIIAHPRTGEDLINEFTASNGKTYRYFINKYQNMCSSQELFEATKAIRKELAQFSPLESLGAFFHKAVTYPFFKQKEQTKSLDSFECKVRQAP